MSLDLYSEPFPASGGIDARSVRRAIGKPNVGFWELFLRETLQNSWDARRESAITYSVEGIRLGFDQMTLLRNQVFKHLPSNALKLAARVDTRTFRLLVIADSGTRGLGGQTRADIASPEGQSTDFVDFVRNIGRAESKRIGGGTYGFGKGVLYDASDVDTCMIYSQTLIDGTIENRFIGVSVGDELVVDGARFTGRHWWGELESSGILEPLRGIEARELALKLGLTKLGASQTGTSIAVIEPVLNDGETVADIVNALSEAALLWAWPHMIDKGSGGPTIFFEFWADGELLPTPDPTSDPQFAQFARAFERASRVLASGRTNEEWPWWERVIMGQRPVVRLGALAHRSYSPPAGLGSLKYPRHVALMRSPLFIVRYMEVQEDANGQALAGVFLAAHEQDALFAKAEPVAHDDWIPASLGLLSGETNPVRIALNKIRDEFKSRVSLETEAVGEEHATGIAALSRQLGALLASVDGSGVDVPSTRGAVSSAARTAPSKVGVIIRLDPNVQLIWDEGRTIACFPFSVSSATGANLAGLTLMASTHIVLDGGSTETEVPVGAESPVVLGWFTGDERLGSSASIPLMAIASGMNTLRVLQPAGVAIGVDIRAVNNSEAG